MNITYSRMSVNAIYSIPVIFYEIVHKSMRRGSKEEDCYHKAPGYLI